MSTNIGEILAVRVNSFRDKECPQYGSGVIYKTKNDDYDLIFTAKHCICRNSPEDCKNICDLCIKPDYAKNKVLIDNFQDIKMLDGVKIESFHFSDINDLAILKISKLDIKDFKVPFFTNNTKFKVIKGWGFPKINNSEELTQCTFKDVSPVVGKKNKMWLPFDSNMTSDLNPSQSNMSGFSGAGIWGDNKYLIGIYTETQVSPDGKGIVFNEDVNTLLNKNELEIFDIENNTQIIKTKINEEFLDCFDKIDTISTADIICNTHCIRFDGRRPDVQALQDRLGDNVRYYAFSEKTIKSYEDRKLRRKLENDSLSKYLRHESDEKVADLFAFSFLEADLKAPKLFSQIEIDNPFKSIHINVNNNKSYNLIHSIGSMDENLSKAIGESFSFIAENMDNAVTPNSLISNSIAESSFNDETYEKLKDIIIPKREEIENEMYNSFGVFVGFNINVKEFLREKIGYKNSIHNKIKQTVKDVLNETLKQLKYKKIEMEEINIYVVPFNDMKEFSNEFINSLEG